MDTGDSEEEPSTEDQASLQAAAAAEEDSSGSSEGEKEQEETEDADGAEESSSDDDEAEGEQEEEEEGEEDEEEEGAKEDDDDPEDEAEGEEGDAQEEDGADLEREPQTAILPQLVISAVPAAVAAASSAAASFRAATPASSSGSPPRDASSPKKTATRPRKQSTLDLMKSRLPEALRLCQQLHTAPPPSFLSSCPFDITRLEHEMQRIAVAATASDLELRLGYYLSWEKGTCHWLLHLHRNIGHLLEIEQERFNNQPGGRFVSFSAYIQYTYGRSAHWTEQHLAFWRLCKDIPWLPFLSLAAFQLYGQNLSYNQIVRLSPCIRS